MLMNQTDGSKEKMRNEESMQAVEIANSTKV